MCVGGERSTHQQQPDLQPKPQISVLGLLQPGLLLGAFVSWHKADGSTQGPAHRPWLPTHSPVTPARGKAH